MTSKKTPPDHGTRSCYVRWSCRCDACREANRRYAAARSAVLVDLAKRHNVKPKMGIREWTSSTGTEYDRIQYRMCPGRNGVGCPHKSYLRKDSKGNLCGHCREGLIRRFALVSATKAREHLIQLQKLGLGLRSIAYITELSRSGLAKIRSGERRRIDPDTSAAILEVELPREPLARTALVCTDCEHGHKQKARLEWIKEHLPATLEDLTNAKPCVYGIEKGVQPNRSKGRRYLYRDLTSVGAKPLSKDDDDRPIWGIPKGSQELALAEQSL